MRLTVAAVVVLQLGAMAAYGQPQEAGNASGKARRYLERGVRHYQMREYRQAIEAFENGYSIGRDPEFLFALGRTYQALSRCSEAITYYQMFLGTHPAERHAREAEVGIERCQPFGSPTSVPVPTTQPLPRPRAHPWYRDWIGLVLTGVGLTGLVTGIALWASGREAVDRMYAATNWGTFDARWQDHAMANRMQTAGVTTAAVGGALIAAGVVRYILRYRGATERTALSVMPTAGGAVVSAVGSLP